MRKAWRAANLLFFPQRQVTIQQTENSAHTVYVLRIEYYVYTTTSARQFQACKDFTMHLWWSLTSNWCKHLPKLWWDQTWKHTMLSSHRGWSCLFINICVYGNMYICGSDSLHLRKSAHKYLLPRTNSYQGKSKEFDKKTHIKAPTFSIFSFQHGGHLKYC